MKYLIYVFLTLYTSASLSNEVYINQAGDYADVDIVVQGSNNQIKGITTVSAPVTGNSNTINVNQGYDGNNLLQLDVSGHNNSVVVGQEKAYSSGSWTNDTNSYGHHDAKVDIAGDYNEVQIVQRNNNSSSAGHTSSVIITNGDNNAVTTLQTGTGSTNGHNSYVHVKNGRDGNIVDIFQNSDTADHKATVSVYSNNNIIDINQTGTTQNKTYVLFSHNSTGPTDFTLNQNGGDTYGNPDTASYSTIYCGTTAGCTLTINQ